VPGFFDTHGGADRGEEKAPEESLTFEQGWQQDLELAYGEMALLPEQFLEMRPCDWIARKRGYYRKEEKQWEHTRLIVAALTGEKPTKIIRLSSDIPKKGSTTTKSDAQRILEKYKTHLQSL
jgi:hypothetical protein